MPMGWVQPQEEQMGTEAESARSASALDLEKGVCYLVKEKKPELSYRLFEALVNQKILEDNNGEGVVLLDGLEYLIINNGFLQTLMFVEHVNEFVMQRRAILLLPVSPDTREVSRLLDSY